MNSSGFYPIFLFFLIRIKIRLKTTSLGKSLWGHKQTTKCDVSYVKAKLHADKITEESRNVPLLKLSFLKMYNCYKIRKSCHLL